MFYTRGYACAWSSESQGVIINADEHSLFTQSLISAKEEGGTALPPSSLSLLKIRVRADMCSTSSRALDQFSPYLNNNKR